MNSLLIFILALGSLAQAHNLDIDSLLSKCKPATLQELSKYGSQNLWKEYASEKKQFRTFRSPTKTFGTWIEIQIFKQTSPKLAIINNLITREITLNNSCASSEKINPGLDFQITQSAAPATWLNDEVLQKIIKHNPKGLIYIWSPGMSFSAKYYKHFQTVAEKLKIKFIPVIDPNANIASVNKAQKVYGLPESTLKLNSVEIYMREVMTHFPTTLLFKNGKLSHRPIVGVMEVDQLEHRVRQGFLTFE